MVRTHFEQRKHLLQDSVLELGSMVDKSLHQAMDALRWHDLVLSQTVINKGQSISLKRLAVERDGCDLVADFRPDEAVRRLITSVIAIAGELNNMGHRARGIARISQLTTEHRVYKPLIDLNRMAEKCSFMLNAALDAFLNEDEEQARNIAAADDYINNIYDLLYDEVVNMLGSGVENARYANYLWWVIQNLEQFGDEVVNICERIVFIVSGSSVMLHNCRPVSLPIALSGAKLELEW
jgi:phosphate transport system protein